MDDKAKISTGPNERARNESIAGRGPGIADDALSPGQELPEAPSDEDVERAARALGLRSLAATTRRSKASKGRLPRRQAGIRG